MSLTSGFIYESVSKNVYEEGRLTPNVGEVILCLGSWTEEGNELN